MRWTMVLVALAVGSLMGCGDDSPPAGGSSGSSGSSGDSTTMPMPTTMTMTDTTTSSMTSGASSTGPGTTTVDPTTTTVADSGSSDTATDSGSSSGDTGPDDPQYPACELGVDPVCPPPYDMCYDFAPGYSVCTSPCMDDTDCPVPATGDATVVCAGPVGDQCLLDCSGGETCPDGMDCVDVAGGMFVRCLWPD